MTKKLPMAKMTVLVTGVSSGIGQTLAEDLLEHGYEVLGSVRKIQDADALCARWSGSFTPLVFDVTDAAALPGIATQVQTMAGDRGLKALVNNAGISLSGPLMHQPLSEFRKVFDVNLFGTLAVTQTFLPMLGARRDRIGAPGRVVNIGSIAGALTVPFMSAYSASKHALEALTQGLRRELIPYGIHVCAVEPGFVQSKLSDKRAIEKLHERYASTDYPVWLEQFDRAITFQEQNAPPAVKVAEAVRHAIESKKPRTRYPLDPLWNIARRMPDEKFDRLIFDALGIAGEAFSAHGTRPRSQCGEV